MNDDLISRQAAIDAVENIDWYHIGKTGELVHGANSQEHEPLYKEKDIYAALERLPSAQPEFAKDTNVPTNDCISRQAAITLPVMPKEHREYQTYNLDDVYEQGWFDLQKCIEELPSAQPEKICVAKVTMTDEQVKEAFENAKMEILTLHPDLRTGKWIETIKHYKDDEQEYDYIEENCSECGVRRKIGWRDARYCPNCGADMRGEQDEAD